jgi:tRNA dimethylallyltransferase
MAEAVAQSKRDTRRYTKRQATWFRNQLPQFAWVEPPEAAAAVAAQLRQLRAAAII